MYVWIKILTIISITRLAACNSSSQITEKQKETNMADSDYAINAYMGESAEALINGNSKIFSEYKTGTIVGFIRPNVAAKDENKLKLNLLDKTDHSSLNFDSVQNLLFVSDYHYKQYGITDLSFEIPISGPSQIKDNLNFLMYAKVIKNLKLNGWKVFYYHSEPRVFGKESFELNTLLDKGSLDGYYLDDYNKWSKYSDRLELSSLNFYKNGSYLTISFRAGIDSYIFDMKFATSFSNYFYQYDEKIRDKEWKALLKNDLEKWDKQRKVSEVNLQKKGYKIDQSYISI